MFDFFLSDRERDIACMQATGYPRRYRGLDEWGRDDDFIFVYETEEDEECEDENGEES